MPPNFIERTLQSRTATGGMPNPQSFANVKNPQKMFAIDDRTRMREVNARVAAAKATEQKAQAVLSSGYIDPAAKTSYAKLTPSAVDEVSKVTQKKALSLRTMERLMSSHTLAAGVAAGGLGIMYAFNRRRGEEQVGR
jgi:cell pole-organizing protein PopZ